MAQAAALAARASDAVKRFRIREKLVGVAQEVPAQAVPQAVPRAQILSRSDIMGKAVARVRRTMLGKGSQTTAKSHWLGWCD